MEQRTYSKRANVVYETGMELLSITDITMALFCGGRFIHYIEVYSLRYIHYIEVYSLYQPIKATGLK